MKTFKFAAVLTLLLLTPVAAFAAVPWTGAPSTAAVDEDSTSIFAYGTSSLGYNASGSTSTITARLNVTDTTATGLPGWTTMEIRSYDPDPSTEVRAQLVRLTAGGTSTIATCTSSDSAVITTSTCSLLNSVDFNSGYIYAVVIRITRTNTTYSPFITGVRLY